MKKHPPSSGQIFQQGTLVGVVSLWPSFSSFGWCFPRVRRGRHKTSFVLQSDSPRASSTLCACVCFWPIFVRLGHRCGTTISAAVNSGCFPTARAAVDLTKMAMRAVISRRLANPGWDALAARSGIRRGFSGKVLGEEERAAENIYIKVRFHFLRSCRFRFSATPASLAQGLKNVG
jgi:hypothetical protein